jgi:hypothetical protein
MAAGLGFKTFTTGEVLTAADTNGYLMQGINVFASTAARDAAITSPQEGQFAFTKDTNGLWYYDGAAWVASGATGDIEGVTAGIGISGGGTSGTVTVTNSMATAIDAKGDLIAGTGADAFARRSIGANNTVLTADSAEATGMKWATPTSGGMTLLSTTSCSGATTTVSSIDQTYTNLLIVVDNYKFNTGAAYPTFNLGIGANGYQVTLTGNGFYTANVFGNAATAAIFPTYDNTVTNGQPTNFSLLITRYSSSDTHKPFNWQGTFYNNGQSALRGFIGGGGQNSTSAITSFALSNNTSYTASAGTIYVYGVK